jgi:uncharacterized protein YcbK (DUF882 family)
VALFLSKKGKNMRHKDMVKKKAFKQAFRDATGLKDLLCRLRGLDEPSERSQALKMQHYKPRNAGAMHYLGLKIVRKMQEAGYPSRIQTTYRPPHTQNEMYVTGRSKARAWESPHQYYEAVDIVHETKYWKVSEEYWKVLAVCVRVVADESGVELEHGHYWRFKDSAHVEIKSWRELKLRYLDRDGKNRVMAPHEILERFVELLPNVPLNDRDTRILKGL